jgi:hypothetical protein
MARITIRDVHASAKKCEQQLRDLGYIVPSVTQYRITSRMTRALGNCSSRQDFFGNKTRVVISLSADLPLSSLDNTMIHEQIHAVLPHGCGHGPKFQYVAKLVNRKYGYNVTTYASREETQEVMANRVVSGTMVQINCSCGAVTVTTKIKANKVLANPHGYGCRKCGKHGQFSRG